MGRKERGEAGLTILWTKEGGGEGGKGEGGGREGGGGGLEKATDFGAALR